MNKASTIIFLLILGIAFGGSANAQIQQDEALKVTAEQFFLNLAEENGKDVTQKFELTNEMRSWLQEEQSIATVQSVLRPYGIIGEIQKKEIVRHDAELMSVELFYSGTRRPFMARVTFQGNQIAGIHFFPQTGCCLKRMSILETISWGFVLIMMLIMSLLLLNGKGTSLTAGENMSKYDERALYRYMGVFVLWMACCVMFVPFSIHSGVAWMPYCAGGLIVVSILAFVFYANTGNRFYKKGYVEKLLAIDIEVGTEIRNKVGRWLLQSLTVIVIASFVLYFPVHLSLLEKEPTVKITDSGITISAGLIGPVINPNIDFSEITNISLVENRIHPIVGGLTRRNHGYGSRRTQRGYFQSIERGNVLLYTRTFSSPTIHIERKDKPDVFLNFSNNEKTRKLYAEMKTAVGR